MNYKKCNEFLKENEVNCCSIIESEQENDAQFSYSGCDCCQDGLGNNVYNCNGYNPENKEIVDLGQICGECLNYFYNGID